jgi:hypothetical protein
MNGPRLLIAGLPSAARTAQRLASASGYLDWWARTDVYLEAAGEPLSVHREVLPLWQAGFDEEGAAHELVRRRKATP